MPTDIFFAGENVRVRVHQEPNQVAEAFAAADGVPFRLTSEGGGGEVYVNPGAVTFWRASEPTPEVEPPPEPAHPPTGREEVTDIWGQPLRRRRGR